MSWTAAARQPASPLARLLDAQFGGEQHGLPAHLWERALGEPAREFLSRPGKQFRARLVETAWLLSGGIADAMPAELPWIVELLHAGSLIVDDIEDSSEQRRGGPALHRMYGIPLALNTGNWMYFWPFELIQQLPIPQVDRERITRATHSALQRCHRGQALDLALRITELTQAEVPQVVRATTRLKTGALMELAAIIGAIAAGATPQVVTAVETFARELGTGLQMLDDIGSVSCPSRLHKGVEDLRFGRPTWPWAWAAMSNGAHAFNALQDQAQEVIAGDRPAENLAQILCTGVADAGRARVHTRLGLALDVLRDNFEDTEVIDLVGDEISRLENSYG